MMGPAIPDGYTLSKSLHRGRWRDIVLAVRDDDATHVVLKIFSRVRAAADRARREHDALRACAGPRIPRALDLVLYGEHPTLVLEWVRGISFAEWIRPGARDPAALLAIAARVAEALAHVHENRWVHRDVTPANIVVDVETLEAALVDFGIAVPLGSVTRGRLADPKASQAGTLRYIAPEQTGRMNRGFDYRSDLYTLGASLYHGLTGRPPFEDTDPLALIHAHIACDPEPPHALQPEVPEPLSRLVLKLLRKEPEERYQSARALLSDLRALETDLAEHGEIRTGFTLGAADAPDRLRFASRLYGREREIEQLERGFERSASGRAVAVWVVGGAGSGKTTLVQALRPRLGQSGGYLALGKFDLYQDRAYSAWIAALESLVQQLLLESDERLAGWRRELLRELGPIARVLLELVHDLEFILGDVPPVPALGPRENLARLGLALERCLRVFATPTHPLVLVLDDLQWSDPSSRALLWHVLRSQAPGALLLVGCYRSEAIDEDHPLSTLIADVASTGLESTRISLGPLEPEPVLAMIAEALHAEPSRVRPLAEEISRKTGNSPLLIRQLMGHLCDGGLLRHVAGTWEWDLPAIAAAAIPDGAVGLMTGKIDRLEDTARELLQFASCVGDEFDVELLHQLSGRDRAALQPILHALCDAGLILPGAHGFRFAHDRIREAAQSLLPEEARARLHYESGRWLLEHTPEDERKARVFEIVEHLNRGLAHLPEELRPTLIELDLSAGRRALRSGAAPEALAYLSIGCDLFRADDWRDRRALGFELFLHAADAAFQTGDFERTQNCLDVLDRQNPTGLETARIAIKRIHVRALRETPERCVRYSLEVLAGLGVRWPLHPSRLRTRWAVWRVRRALRGRSSENLLVRAEAVDPSWLAPIVTLAPASAMFMQVDSNLAALAASHALGIFARHGYVGRPGFSLAAYALCALQLSWDAAQARRDVETANEWMERLPDPVLHPRARLTLSALVQPWLLPRRQAIAPLDGVAEQAREIGDPEFAYYARRNQSLLLALAGEAVPQVATRFRSLTEDMRRSGPTLLEATQGLRVYELLMARDLDRRDLADALGVARWELADSPPSTRNLVATLWLQLLCVHGRFDLAFEESEAVKSRLFRVAPYVHVADHTLYRGLAAADLAHHVRGHARRRLQRVLQTSIRRLARWARGGPDFSHMEKLLRAERSALRGDPARAAVESESAARQATERQFVHHAALAYERRGRWLASLRRETEAAEALAQAMELYDRWGAPAKVTSVARQRSGLLGIPLVSPGPDRRRSR